MTYLVIQGLDVETRDLKAVAKRAGATRIENIGNNAFRLHDYQGKAGVAEYCAEAKLDFAFVPVPRKLSDFRLLVMDMDSTLITIETIDELADLVGRKAEVAAITAQAMWGEIADYDESLRRRVAALKGLPESALERLYTERLMLSPGAERMIAGVKRAGLKILLVSGGFSVITVSSIESGAGSVGVPARPALPSTRTTSRNCAMIRSVVRSSRCALSIEMPGIVNGM